MSKEEAGVLKADVVHSRNIWLEDAEQHFIPVANTVQINLQIVHDNRVTFLA